MGQTLDVSLFEAGELVDVTGVSKGHGFTGTIARHHFKRGPKTHGSNNYRQPGSIGAGTTPGRVFKGTKMGGHMGDERVTVKKLQRRQGRRRAQPAAGEGRCPRRTERHAAGQEGELTMAKTAVLKADGAKGASVDLADGLFGAPVNTALIHQAAVRQLAGRRVGTADTLTRAEVRGGGRKPWRQKGTGRARQGSRRAPQWAGGGVVFGPHPRAYDQKMNTKMRRAALRGVLERQGSRRSGARGRGLRPGRDRHPRLRRAAQCLGGGRQGAGGAGGARPRGGALLPEPARGARAAGRQPECVDLLEADTIVFTRDALTRAEEVYA